MNANCLFGAGLLAVAAALSGCASPQKVLVANAFSGEDKTSKLLILDSGAVDPSTKKRLFNVYVRMCDLDAKNNEAACKDTVVLDNVVPGTVY